MTLGQTPNLLGALVKLYEALTGNQPAFLDEEQAVLKLREKLENRNCLLVIDDVWQKAHLKPFLTGGKQTCARLITTRRPDIVIDARRVQVDQMTPDESGALVAALLPAEYLPSNLALLLRPLTARLMEWPLLLKLAAGVMRVRLERGDTFEKSLEYLSRLYNKRGLLAFDPKYALERNDAVAKSIDASLEQLDKDDQEARARLRELAIFSEDTAVPLSIVELIWGLDDLDTQQIAELLANYGLVDLDLLGGLVRLHDEIHSYLQRAISDEATLLHGRLLDRLGNPKTIQDGYALRWLAWHLGKAGRHAELRTLLLDFQWMMAKLEKADIQSLLADYDQSANEACLHLVRDAIRLSAHVLVRDRGQLASQLTGRLLGIDDNDIQALLRQTAEKAPRPWLRPLRANLTPPGGPLIRILEGHGSSVTGVAITPDGRRAVSSSWDHTLRVWDLESGRCLCTLEGHSHWVNGVAITPDGRRAVSASSDRTLRVWDLESGQCLRTLEGHSNPVDGVAITPDGRRAVSASFDYTVQVWDLDNGQSLRTLKGDSSPVNGVAILPDGRQAVSATSWAHTLRMWDLDSGKCLRTLEGHSDSVTGVTITPDGRRALSASWDKTLRVWDLDSGQCLRALEGHSNPVTGVAITPDGRQAVSTSDDRTLRVWDLDSGQWLRTLEGHSDWVTRVAITSDARRAVSVSDDKTLRVWDLDSGQCLRTLEGHNRPMTGVAVTPNGRWAVSASDDKTLRVWDLDSGQCLRTLEGHNRSVTGVAVTPNGRHAISASWDHTLRVWDLESGKELALLTADSPTTSCAVSLDGRTIVAGDATGKIHFLRMEGLGS